MTASTSQDRWPMCFRTHWRRIALISVAIICYCNTSAAQNGIIVRLLPSAPEVLQASLAEGSAKAGALSRLFSDVSAVSMLPIGDRGEAFVLSLADTTGMSAFLAQWQREQGVAYAQLNRLHRLDGLNGTADTADSLSHLSVIGARSAWTTTEGVPTVRVGVVDTGLWFEHPAFDGQVAVNSGEDLNGNGRLDAADLNGLDDDGNGYVDDVSGFDFVDRGLVLFDGDFRGRDGDPSEDPVAGAGRGHGTAVSGAIAAGLVDEHGVRGVAPGTRLMPLRAFGSDGLGEDDDIAAAIVYAGRMRLDVLNLSFGDVYRSPVMQDAIAYAVSQGVVVIASGGNDGMAQPHYPSDYPEVISVAWLTEDGLQRNGRASRSPGIDLGAPGSQIYTTLFRPTETAVRYGRESGSSVAAPLVSGVAALLRSLDPDLSPASIRTILTATARDIEESGWDEGTGAGLVQADRALMLALPARLEIHSPVMDAGVSANRIAVVATAIDPAFGTLHVEYATGAAEPFSWIALGETMQPALRDTVAMWDVGSLDEGTYTLRLRLEREDGGTVEERARVTVDRSAPVFIVRDVRGGLAGGAYAVIADIETNDRSAVHLAINGEVVRSDRVARRHGLVWEDQGRQGGDVMVQVTATNVAGLTTTAVYQLHVPAWRTDAASFTVERLDIPAGYLLPESTDFDGDGWREVVVNQAPEGAVGDTLAFWEATSEGFARRRTLIATVIPRDAGDTDGDGRGELLGQIQAAALLLEATSANGFPDALAFVDTTGLDNPTDAGAFYGAVLADLDGDGRGEIIGHNSRQIRVLEGRGASFAEVARLDNGTEGGETFSEPDFRVADLNGNGRPELIAPDADGDVLAFEATGNDTYALAWSIETDDESLRSTLAIGDMDGDGAPELLTFTQNRTSLREDREREPAIATFRVFAFTGGQPDTLVALTAYGAGYAFAGAALADLDGDGRDEIVVGYPPDLYVLRWSGTGLDLVYHQGDDGSATPAVVRSPALTVGDFDRDGRPEVIAAFSDGWSYRLRHRDLMAPTAPEWIAAYARDDSTVVLRWYATADSVTIFAGPQADSLAPLASIAADSLVLTARAAQIYALRAWRQERASDFSPLRTVTPHAPGHVVQVRQPAANVVEIEADVPLAEPTVSAVRVDGLVPLSALRLDAHIARFAFERDLASGMSVQVVGLRDTSGTPLRPSAWPLPVVSAPEAGLFIVGADVLGGAQVRLTFSNALDPGSISPAAFDVLPAGTVAEVALESPAALVLTITGVSLRPSGLNVTIRANGLRSTDGTPLLTEGASVLLAEPASDLRAAFVFPNPVRLDRHDHLTLGGAPSEVEALVMSVDGTIIRRLSADASRGGLEWDLRDDAGSGVPSGMYLIRLTAPGSTPILLKAALIR